MLRLRSQKVGDNGQRQLYSQVDKWLRDAAKQSLGGKMPSSNYATLRAAIQAKQQIVCDYQGRRREM